MLSISPAPRPFRKSCATRWRSGSPRSRMQAPSRAQPDGAYRQFVNLIVHNSIRRYARRRARRRPTNATPTPTNSSRSQFSKPLWSRVARSRWRPISCAAAPRRGDFRFSTVRLDLRENTTRTTSALCDLCGRRARARPERILRSGAPGSTNKSRRRRSARGTRKLFERDARHYRNVRVGRRTAKQARPRGLRQFHPLDDAQRRDVLAPMCSPGSRARAPELEGRLLHAADRAVVRTIPTFRMRRRSCANCCRYRSSSAAPSARAICKR